MTLPALPNDDEIEYDDAIRLGRIAVQAMGQPQWFLGALAAKCKPKYGERTLMRLAADIEIEPDLLSEYRRVYKAFGQIPARAGNSFAVYRKLASQPDCRELIDRRQWTQKEAERFVARRNRERDRRRGPRPSRPVLNISQLTSAIRDYFHDLSQEIMFNNRELNSLREFQGEMTTSDLNKLKEGLEELAIAVKTTVEQFTNSTRVVQLRRLTND